MNMSVFKDLSLFHVYKSVSAFAVHWS